MKIQHWLALGAVVVGVGGAAAYVSYASALKDHAEQLATTFRLQAVASTTDTVLAGATPGDWPVRAFVPAAAIQTIADALSGTKVVIPVGVERDGHVDGYITALLSDLTVRSDDSAISMSVLASATFSPDRENPWWAGAKADVEISGLLLPQGSHKDENGRGAFDLQFVPDSVAVHGSYGPLDLSARQLTSELVAHISSTRFSERLRIRVPDVAIDPEVDISINSMSNKKFGGKGGSTDIAMKMDRKPVRLGLALNRFVVVKGGIWVLGGKDFPAIAPTRLDGDVAEHLAGLAPKLDPYRQPDNRLVVALSKQVLVDFTNKLLAEGALKLDVKTTNTVGNLTEANLEVDKVGDIGIEVRPEGDPFGTASATVVPTAVTWTKDNGLGIEGKVSASARIRLNVHFNTGIGGGIGKQITFDADAEAPFSVNGALRERDVAGHKIVAFEPVLSCSKISIDVSQGPTSGFDLEYVLMQPFGLNIGMELGEGKLSPAVLLSSAPRLVELGNTYAQDGTLVDHAPDETVVVFPAKYLRVATLMEGTETTGDGIVVKSRLTATVQDAELTEAEARLEGDLEEAAKGLVPETVCSDDLSVSVTTLGVKGIDLVKFAMAVQRNLKAQIQVAEHVLKAMTALDPYATADNLKAAADITLDNTAQNIVDVNEQVNTTLKSALDVAHVGGDARKVVDGGLDLVSDGVNKGTDLVVDAGKEITGTAAEVIKDPTVVVTKPVEAAKDLGEKILCGFC